MSDETIYRSRWATCNECETTTLVERDDERGVPDYQDWEEFGSCMVCGSSLQFGDADEQTQRETALRQGERAFPRVAAKALRDAADDLASRGHRSAVTRLRERANEIDGGGDVA